MSYVITKFMNEVISSLYIVDPGPGMHFIGLFIDNIINNNFGDSLNLKDNLLKFIDVDTILNSSKFANFVSILNGTFSNFSDYINKIGKIEVEVNSNITTEIVRDLFLVIKSLSKNNIHILNEFKEKIGITNLFILRNLFYKNVDEYIGKTKDNRMVILNDRVVLSLKSKYILKTKGTPFIPLMKQLKKILYNILSNGKVELSNNIMKLYYKFLYEMGRELSNYVELESYILKRHPNI